MMSPDTEKHVWSATGCLYDIYHVKANTLKITEASRVVGSSIFVPKCVIFDGRSANKKEEKDKKKIEKKKRKLRKDFFTGCAKLTKRIRQLIKYYSRLDANLNKTLREIRHGG